MRQFRKSTTAVIVGLGALALLATPSFAAGSHSMGAAGAPLQSTQMGQGQGGQWSGQSPYPMGQDQGGQWSGQPCPLGKTGPGTMAPGMSGQGMMGPGMMGPGTGGQGMMGPGMMGSGTGGQGMMGSGFGEAPGLGSQAVPSKDLTADDVRHVLEHRLEMRGNKRLKVGDVKEAGDDKIVAEIITVDGSLVQRLEVDRHTGNMQHVQ